MVAMAGAAATSFFGRIRTRTIFRHFFTSRSRRRRMALTERERKCMVVRAAKDREGSCRHGCLSRTQRMAKRARINERDIAIADPDVTPNEEFIFCQGGAGGKGNVHFKSSRTVRRANTPKAKRASTEIFFSSCARSPTPGWSVIRTPENRHCCEKFRRRGRKSRHIHSRRCIRLSVWWSSTPIIARRSPIFPA